MNRRFGGILCPFFQDRKHGVTYQTTSYLDIKANFHDKAKSQYCISLLPEAELIKLLDSNWKDTVRYSTIKINCHLYQ
jgi:hypothetical protein